MHDENGQLFSLPAVGFQNAATGPDLGFQAARSYSLIRPPRTVRRWIRSWERSAGGWSGRGGPSWRLRWGRSLGEASALAAEAASEFRRLAMPARASEAAKVAADITARRRSASPLSAREEEVASLVAQALSNRQIADRLVLSERTVETHVHNILAKLNFSTRAEIATWVLRASSASTTTGA